MQQKTQQIQIYSYIILNITSMEFLQMYFLSAAGHLYQTCKLKHQNPQALQPHYHLVVCFQPAAKNIKENDSKCRVQNKIMTKLLTCTDLYISMDMSLSMQVFQSLKGFFKDRTNSSLIKTVRISNFHKV